MLKALMGRYASPAVKGIVALVSGATVAQAAGIVALPLLTRLYGPTSFGTFAYIVSLVLIVSTFGSLKLEWAIPLPAERSIAQAILRTSLYMSSCLSGIALLVVVIWHEQITHYAGTELFPWILWLPPLVLLTSWFNVLSQGALRERAYGSVATRSIAQGLGTTLGQLSMAVFTRSPGGLLTGQLVGRAIGVATLAAQLRDLLRRPASGSFRSAIREYWRIPVIFAPSAILNTIGTQLPLIVVTLWFGLDNAGLFGGAQRIVLIPATFVGAAASQVFAAELAACLRSGRRDNRRIYMKATKSLGTIAIAILAIVLTLSKALVPLILGPEWVQAGEFSQALAISVSAGFVAAPVSYVFVAYQRTLLSLAVDSSRIVLVLGLGLWSRTSGDDPLHVVWAMSLGQFVNYAITWCVGLWIVSNSTPINRLVPR